MLTATGMAAPSRSIIEAAALAEPAATFTPAVAQAEREQEAILGLNPAISESRTLAILRGTAEPAEPAAGSDGQRKGRGDGHQPLA